MKKVSLILILFLFTILILGCGMEKTNILLFNKTNGYIHKSIPAGTKAIVGLSEEYNYDVTVSDDSLIFRSSKLADFDVIVFMSTSGNIFDDEGKQAFKEYISNGGGFVGIHGASTTEYEWDWFGKMIGNHFDDHPKIQPAKINVINSNAPSTKHLPKVWEWTDEWYNWRYEFDENIEVLLTVDESTYEGGKHGGFHPISWRQEYEGGRSWYTAIGHDDESYKDDNLLKHIAGGINWAAGK